MAQSPSAAAAGPARVHAHVYIYTTPGFLTAPGTKRFVTCAFTIAATKGRTMSFQISVEGGEGAFKGALFS